MSENDSQQGKKKTDWSFTDSVRRASRRPEADHDARAIELVGSIAPAVIAKQETEVALPVIGTALGILGQWRAAQNGRKATLDALDTQYKGALELLKHRIQMMVQSQKARADVDYKIYIEKLDQEYLEIWASLGLRNKDVRERTLFQLSEMTAARLREVQDADWPRELKDATISDLFAVRERFVAEIMKELGGGA